MPPVEADPALEQAPAALEFNDVDDTQNPGKRLRWRMPMLQEAIHGRGRLDLGHLRHDLGAGENSIGTPSI